MASKFNFIPDLAFAVGEDGSIELAQEDDCNEPHRITLHACHVRHLFEVSGHLLPPPSADELSKRLARQLCSVLLDLCEETGCSPAVDHAIDTLIAYKQALPDSVFPYDLYENEQELSPSAAKSSTAERPEFQLEVITRAQGENHGKN